MNLNALLESGLLNEAAKKEIQEAWDSQLSEAREQVAAEMREEFANRYEHDKTVMVEAANRMFTEALEAEIESFKDEKRKLEEARTRTEAEAVRQAKVINEFVTRKLHDELVDLQEDRVRIAEGFNKLEQFAVRVLGSELKELHEDKQKLNETRVALIKEADAKIAEVRKDFVSRAAIIAESAIESSLRHEIGTFREDIREAKENNFGREMFEAFASTFMTSFYSRDKEVVKLRNTLAEQSAKLEETLTLAESATTAVENSEKRAKIAEARLHREKSMSKLLAPLNESQRKLMGRLLEGVKTKDLSREFDKHFEFVFNEKVDRVSKTGPLTESANSDTTRAITGNKRKGALLSEDTSNTPDDIELINQLQHLAGIKK